MRDIQTKIGLLYSTQLMDIEILKAEFRNYYEYYCYATNTNPQHYQQISTH